MAKNTHLTLDERATIEVSLREGTSFTEIGRLLGKDPSTISTWYRRNLQPSISSIEKICKGLDISLSHFFSSPEDQCVNLTDSQQEILDIWKYLNEEQKDTTIKMLKSFMKN
nr:helix-turn-helix domain-containing protein [uncultured Clostridium sp.]